MSEFRERLEAAASLSERWDIVADMAGAMDGRDPEHLKAVPTGEARQVYDYWAKIMQKRSNAQLTPERRRAIQGRLKTYTIPELMEAIEGCARSDFHMARGDYKGMPRYNDILLICRNGANVERFREFPGKAAPSAGFLT